MPPQLKKIIMGRVYRAYLLSIVFHHAFVHGLALSISAGLLAQVISIPDIVRNFVATPVGRIPHFIWGSFADTEWLVIALIGAIVLVLLSFSFNFKQRRPLNFRTS